MRSLKALTVAEARRGLARYSRTAAAGGRFLLTAHGRPEAVLMGYRDYLAQAGAAPPGTAPGAVILAGHAPRSSSRPRLVRDLRRLTVTLRRAGVRHLGLILPEAVMATIGDTLPADDLVLRPAPRSGLGFAPSLKKGLRLLRGLADPVFVVFATQPAVKPATLRRLLAAWRRTEAAAVTPIFQGRGGHPVLLSERLAGEALRMDPRRGLIAVMRRHRAKIARVPVEDSGVLKR